MIRIEVCKFRDLGRVTNFEAATQEFPKNQEEVKHIFESPSKDAYCAYVGTRAVGCCLVTFDKAHGVTAIDSIGVHPLFRRIGVATKLTAHVLSVSHSDGMDKLNILVPSYLVVDKEDPWNIEHWLWRTQFKAIGTMPDPCRRYGKDYDLYVFERKFDEQTT
jgi:GNAT superfamily N-acetyltransferase